MIGVLLVVILVLLGAGAYASHVSLIGLLRSGLDELKADIAKLKPAGK